MDELIIDEKKYIPSKQAAKITGYAKDYIGQLCREGRVPARLVGRSWYVLESAIQDHRFGSKSGHDEPIDTKESNAADTPVATHEWSSVRYEATSAKEVLPPVGHSKVMQESEMAPATPGAVQHTQEDMHDAWQEWFSHVTDSMASVSETAFPNESVPVEEVDEQEDNSVPLHIASDETISEETHSKGVGVTNTRNTAENIDKSYIRSENSAENSHPESQRESGTGPVSIARSGHMDIGTHSVRSAAGYPAPRVDRMNARQEPSQARQDDTPARSQRRPTRKQRAARTGQSVARRQHSPLLVYTVRVLSFLLAAAAVALLVLGSGFVDSFAISDTQVHMLSGIFTYIR